MKTARSAIACKVRRWACLPAMLQRPQLHSAELHLRGADALRERLRPSPAALAQRGPPPASPLAAVPASESSRAIAVPLGPCPGVESPLRSPPAAPGEPSLSSSPLSGAKGRCPFAAAAAAAEEGDRPSGRRCLFGFTDLPSPLRSDEGCPRRTPRACTPPGRLRRAVGGVRIVLATPAHTAHHSV